MWVVIRQLGRVIGRYKLFRKKDGEEILGLSNFGRGELFLVFYSAIDLYPVSLSPQYGFRECVFYQ